MFKKNHKKSTREKQFSSHLRRKRKMNNMFHPKRKLNYAKIVFIILIVWVICITIAQINQSKTNKVLDDITNTLEQIKTDLNTITDKQVQLEEKQKELEIAKAEKKAEEKVKQEAIKVAQASKTVTTRGNTSRATGSKAEYQAYAKKLCLNTYNWTEYDFECLVKLWTKESNWNPNAHNSSSGAHGIPQSLPASKMASEGADYYTNAETQIRWGLKYIKGRYGSPSKAWSFWQSHNWY